MGAPSSRSDAGAAIVQVCRRLYERGLIAGAEGNVSVRLAADRLLVTPAGVAKADVKPEDLVETDLEGTPLDPSREPSSEFSMHRRIYARRPDANAVVHAHPPTATGFAVAGEAMLVPAMPELILITGAVPLVPYAPPGTDALADAVEPYLAEHDALLLANHGATTMGTTLTQAHHRMECVEQAARILLAARSVGGVRPLPDDEVARLNALRARASGGRA